MLSVLVAGLFVLWIVRLVMTRQVIHDADGSTYLIRYFIWRPDWLSFFKEGLSRKAGRIYIHQIVRSDYDRALHDHPWSFRSFMLKGKYREFTTVEDVVKNAGYIRPNKQVKWDYANWPLDRTTVYHDFKAPMFIRRPAAWRHRLELEPGKTTWTLVFIGPVSRRWGFWTTLTKWCHWKSYDTAKGICEEPEVELGEGWDG